MEEKREIAKSILWKHFYNERGIFIGFTIEGAINAMIEFEETIKKTDNENRTI